MISTELIKKEILTEIASILPVDLLEKEHLDFVKAWIASGAEIFRIAKPDNLNIHLVSYFIAVDTKKQDSGYLLVGMLNLMNIPEKQSDVKYEKN